MEGDYARAKRKKSCQAKRVYKALLTKACDPKGVPSKLYVAERKWSAPASSRRARTEGRGRSQGARRPLLPLAQSLPRCPHQMGDLELTQRELEPPPRALHHLQGGRRLPTGRMYRAGRECLTSVSIPRCRHGDRRSHAAPPLPHDVAPPPPNPEARGSRPLREPFGRGESGS